VIRELEKNSCWTVGGSPSLSLAIGQTLTRIGFLVHAGCFFYIDIACESKLLLNYFAYEQYQITRMGNRVVSRLPCGSCCSCISPSQGLVLTASCSLLTCIAVMLPSLYCLVREDVLVHLREWINSWLVRNHWDVEVTQSVWKGLDWLDLHHNYFLGGLVAASATHLLSAVLLLLGWKLERKNLLLPWLVTDLTIIILMVAVFIGWTFLSFFIDLYIAIGMTIEKTVENNIFALLLLLS
jgi:hypothetical protein